MSKFCEVAGAAAVYKGGQNPNRRGAPVPEPTPTPTPDSLKRGE